MVKNPQIILIDGPAGSGKTTLSQKLKGELTPELTCELIHLDEVYSGWDDALGQYLTKTLQDLLTSFIDRQPFELPIYDWHKGKFDSVRTVAPADILIIEGVGAGQSAIRTYATTLYWVETTDEIGLARVLARDGAGIEAEMRLWKIREAKHFAIERTREFADFIISTT